MVSTAKKETPFHILVVEDDPNTADMLTSYFSSLGYEVSHAAWGQDALTIAAGNTPDLVLLDIHLPDIDGYEVCTQLRSRRRTQHTPIIFLTERRERRDRLTGLELGAIDYLTKPFDIQEIRYRVRNILRHCDTEALLHPITGLPTATLIQEQLEQVKEHPELSVVGLSLQEMKAFGDVYGFVTHDDVLRAVALILRNTAPEVMRQDPFVGQLSTYKFLMVVTEAKRYLAMGRLHQRLDEAISFFYPHQDWKSGTHNDDLPLPKIGFCLSYITAEHIPPTCALDQLRDALFPKTMA